MAAPIQWTLAADDALLAARRGGHSWPATARMLGVGRSAAIERARHLGMRPADRPNEAAQPPKIATARSGRDLPLPAGHPIAWTILMELTPSIAAPYPAPGDSRSGVA